MTQQTGAEATLTFSSDSVKKERVPKGYRHSELDRLLRSKRNRKEAKLLSQSPVRSPKLLDADDFSITMERIDGPRLRDALNVDNARELGRKLGGMIRTFHDKELVHGDLTTSNVLVERRAGVDALVLIDFGLSSQSKRLEDKAVDLHVLRETLEGSHVQEKEPFWEGFAAAYDDQRVLDLLKAVESRGRYKKKY